MMKVKTKSLSLLFVFCLFFAIISALNVKNDETIGSDVWISEPTPTPTPVVFYHGMGDTSEGSIYSLQKYLENELKGVYVMSIRMGNNFEEDLIDGFFMNLNDQVVDACRQLTADTRLANGFNAIGFSQGGQILRAIAQRCPDIKIINLISLGGQHQGVYGLPRCPQSSGLCDLVRKLLNYGAYEQYIQSHVVQAQYWHDPIQEELYKSKSVFLADINNENNPRKPEYKERLLKLKNLVLVMFLNDTMVEPRESSLFGFYRSGQSKDVYKMNESALYNEDWIGLKQLDSTGRLRMYEVIGDHLQIDMKWFEEEIVNKFLK